MPQDDAYAQKYINIEGIYIYFPDGEEAIALALSRDAPKIISFLSENAMPVTLPIHIILDKDLDEPEPKVHMIPHREVRIPLRAPGVLEDGYLEKDPWTYFLFKGLCLQGIYSMRSGIPGCAHMVFGEIVSPNIVLPPWILDGICSLKYSMYTNNAGPDPFYQAIFNTSLPPDISRISNHPGVWPGHYGYRIYGVPFIRWVCDTKGSDSLIEFLKVHGRGIIPIEIDLKAKKTLGESWTGLWRRFARDGAVIKDTGRLITGYVPGELVYWNVSGMYPGTKKVRKRGRYGYRDDKGIIWVTEYTPRGASIITGHRGKGLSASQRGVHMWDAGEGGVCVSRSGHVPYILVPSGDKDRLYDKIPAPEGAIALSGPEMNNMGDIAVSANIGGNWDIWIYSGTWHRITETLSIEMDPCWQGDKLVFSSNRSGTFQIHLADMTSITTARFAAVLPRGDSYLDLDRNGWNIEKYEAGEASPVCHKAPVVEEAPLPEAYSRDYTPIKSILPNYIMPDFYTNGSDFQAGIGTKTRDVSGKYSANAAMRYSHDLEYISWRAGAGVRNTGAQVTRYPISYDPELTPPTEESRIGIKVYHRPFGARWIEISANRLAYENLTDEKERCREIWGTLELKNRYRSTRSWLILDCFSGGRKSLYGGIAASIGSEVTATCVIRGGKTWSDYTPGHGSFRIGGDVGEGYFTKRHTRLFPVRGYDPNLIEAGKAACANIEVLFPLADLQKGYKTMPLFLHRLYMGTFIDAGVCADRMRWRDSITGAGIELVTTMEIAWSNMSSFRMGIAWPVSQPDYIDEKGPVYMIQLGRPL